MSKIAPCLWFRSEAEEAAEFYVSLLPDSRIVKVQRNGPDSPAGEAGSVLVVSFTMVGQEFMALNGNPQFEPNNTVSFKIDCADQAETDRLWDSLSSNGGSTLQCGWLKDRYGFAWQIVPSGFMELIGGPDSAGRERAMQAMMKMVKLDLATLQKAYHGG
jgi:predicted 3-demethylubiquinone-9 3-methyltransferase (glyoxalase superfamily)